MVFADSTADLSGTSVPTRNVRSLLGDTRTTAGIAVNASNEKFVLEVIELDEPAARESTQSPLPVFPAQRFEQLPALYDVDVGLLGGGERFNDRCTSCWTL